MADSAIHGLDATVMAVYLAAMLGMSFYYMRQQRSATEFLLASHDIGWFAIGLSLLSSLNSAMDYIVGPASYIQWGLVLGTGIFALMLSFPIVFYVFIPFYQRLNIFNCYEYLERRFDVKVRTTASVIFIVWRICWMSFTIYLPAFALNVVMDLPILPTILVLGAFTTFYTALGGMRAVVWTDVVQAIIMFIGLFLAIALAVRGVPDGLRGIIEVAQDENLLRPVAVIPGWDQAGSWEKVGLYFHYPITVCAIVIGSFISLLTSYGADQVMIQRYLSARSLRDCQMGFFLNSIAYVVYVAMFFVLSMALLAFFRHHPPPSELVVGGRASEFLFPYFIGTQLPPIVKGLVLVAIYSAAQSSVSAGIAAGASVVYANFYARFVEGEVTVAEDIEAALAHKHVAFNRACTLGFGLVVTVGACVIPLLGESLFGLANKIVSNFAGVMIPVFLLGMFSSRARSLGVSIGAIAGVVAMFLWGFGHKLGLFANELGYGWTTTVGFLVTIAVAYVVSYFEPAPDETKLRYLWKQVMASQ